MEVDIAPLLPSVAPCLSPPPLPLFYLPRAHWCFIFYRCFLPTFFLLLSVSLACGVSCPYHFRSRSFLWVGGGLVAGVDLCCGCCENEQATFGESRGVVPSRGEIRRKIVVCVVCIGLPGAVSLMFHVFTFPSYIFFPCTYFRNLSF